MQKTQLLKNPERQNNRSDRLVRVISMAGAVGGMALALFSGWQVAEHASGIEDKMTTIASITESPDVRGMANDIGDSVWPGIDDLQRLAETNRTSEDLSIDVAGNTELAANDVLARNTYGVVTAVALAGALASVGNLSKVSRSDRRQG